MRYRAHHIGRVRMRAAKILSVAFPNWDIRPEDISPALGRYRTDWREDCYRWELFTKTKTGLPVVCGCWLRLTDFVREAGKAGCHVTKDDEIYPGKKEG